MDQRVKAALVSDLFTLIGITPLDRRKAGAEAAQFKRPAIGMYYGTVAGAARGYGQGPDLNRAAATKKAYQEMAKGSASGPRKQKKATQPEEEMTATFYGPNKTQKLL